MLALTEEVDTDPDCPTPHNDNDDIRVLLARVGADAVSPCGDDGLLPGVSDSCPVVTTSSDRSTSDGFGCSVVGAPPYNFLGNRAMERDIMPAFGARRAIAAA
eukprot:1731255-Prymnesium_polylepis.3